jgi:hypothetical protein
LYSTRHALDNDLGVEEGTELLNVEQLVATRPLKLAMKGSPRASRARCRW